jgi:hypothetical protein
MAVVVLDAAGGGGGERRGRGAGETRHRSVTRGEDGASDGRDARAFLSSRCVGRCTFRPTSSSLSPSPTVVPRCRCHVDRLLPLSLSLRLSLIILCVSTSAAPPRTDAGHAGAVARHPRCRQQRHARETRGWSSSTVCIGGRWRPRPKCPSQSSSCSRRTVTSSSCSRRTVTSSSLSASRFLSRCHWWYRWYASHCKALSR